MTILVIMQMGSSNAGGGKEVPFFPELKMKGLRTSMKRSEHTVTELTARYSDNSSFAHSNALSKCSGRQLSRSDA